MRILIALLCALCAAGISAQEMMHSAVEARTMDLDAVTQGEAHKDGNGNLPALLKVNSTVGDLTFESPMIIGTPERRPNGEYWVWLAEGANFVTVRAADRVPLRAQFDRVQSKVTYMTNVTPVASGKLEKRITVSVYPRFGGGSIGAPAQAPKPVEFNMVLIEPGMFQMGGTPEQTGADKDEYPVHWVNFSKPVYMGETEVTQALWQAVMGDNPSGFKGDDLPVENISPRQADEFVAALNKQLGVTGVRLPTEAEWEYAARGGVNADKCLYSGSNNASEAGWWLGNSQNRTHPVKEKAPNALGLYDMSGNVYEIVADNKGEYRKREITDPLFTERGADRVRRGGSWRSENETELRNAYRRRVEPSAASKDTGLRIVLVP